MKSFDFEVKDELGLHARPAGLLAKLVKGYKSNCTLSCNGKTVNCKQLMMIMSMGIKKGATVSLAFDGEDEEAAYEAVKTFFEENL